MRITILLLALLCFVERGYADFKSTEVGVQVAFPLEARDAGTSELGISAGLTSTAMSEPWLGIGMDVAYQYWPVSASYKAGLEDTYYGIMVIDEPTWAFKAIQLGGHVKFVAPISGWCQPWTRLGGAIYFVDSNYEPVRDPLAGASMTRPRAEKSFQEPGYSIGGGVDIRKGIGMKLGLDVTYHHLFLEDEFGADFHAFTVGARVLFEFSTGSN